MDGSELLRFAATIAAAFLVPALGLGLLRLLAPSAAIDADREAFEGGRAPLADGRHRLRLEGRLAGLAGLAVIPLGLAFLLGARRLADADPAAGDRIRLLAGLGLVALVFLVHLRRRVEL